jgi:hypothetical protein
MEDKLRNAIFEREHKKETGPDGFPDEFYQTLYDTIRKELLEAFSFLHAGQLELFRLNFGKIILLPKINETKDPMI